MRHKGKKLERRKLKVIGVTILLTFSFSISTVSAQESVNATGGNASGSGGSTSYTVGHVVYATHAGISGSVAEGALQPYEISVVTGIEKAKDINITASAYPNPTSDYLILEVKDFEISSMHFQLYDMNGKLLQSDKITGNQTSIDLSGLVPATYFVKVIQGNKELKTFKVIKN